MQFLIKNHGSSRAVGARCEYRELGIFLDTGQNYQFCIYDYKI